MLNSSDILRGYTDTIILAQLARGDSYGYVISKNVQEITRGDLSLKEATLYTTFRRLEGAGVIESYWGNENAGARRRYYHLTEEGRRKFLKKALTIPGRTSGITISFKDCHMLAPQERDASIRESCTCSSAAELAFKEKAM